MTQTLTGAEFAALIDRIRPDLVRYAARRVGENDAENAVQLAIIRAYLGLPRYRHINATAFYAWVYQKLRSVCGNHQKRARHAATVSLELTGSLRECRGGDPVAFLERQEAAEEQRRRICEWLGAARLNRMEKRCLLGMLRNEPVTVTAAALAVTAKSVRSNQEAILKRLAAVSGVDGEHP